MDHSDRQARSILVLSAERDAAINEVRELERQLEKLGEKETRLHAKLAEAATEPDRLLSLDAELRSLLGEKEELELRWMEVADLAEG